MSPQDVPQSTLEDALPSHRAAAPPWLRLSPRILMLLPAAAVMLLFAAAVVDLLRWSLFAEGRIGTEPAGSMTLANYLRVVSDPLYVGALLTTLRLSAIAAFASLVLGLPIAHWIVRTDSSRLRATLIILVAIPFMTSLIVRLYALTLFLGNTGLVNWLFHRLGLVPENDFVPLIRNELSVAIGLTYFVLPFVIFTLAGVFKRFDRTLEEAAQNLGADEISTFMKITLPLMMPGILSAGAIAFVLAGTAFATPLVLGGSAVRMVANAIYDQAMFAQNLPMASALCLVALVFTFLSLLGASWLARWRSRG